MNDKHIVEKSEDKFVNSLEAQIINDKPMRYFSCVETCEFFLSFKLIEKKKSLTRTGVGPFEIGVRTCSLRCTANLGL
jgi:hypothetical protein